MFSKIASGMADAANLPSILNDVSNPDKFLATFASDDADSKTKYIDDVMTLSRAGASISKLIPGVPPIPEINEKTKDHINTLVNDDGFKTIISEVNTNPDLKEKVVLKLSDGKYTVRFAGGLIANLKTGNIGAVVTIIRTELDKIKAEPAASANALSSSSAIGSVPTSHAPPSGTATLEPSPIPTLGDGPEWVAPPGASTRTETEIDVKCGEMRKMFQEVLISAFQDTDSKENEMLVSLIDKMIKENNGKLVDIIASTLPITNSSMKIRFNTNFKRKLNDKGLIGGGRKTKQKRQRKQGTKRRK